MCCWSSMPWSSRPRWYQTLMFMTGDTDFAALALQIRRHGIGAEAASLGDRLKTSVNEAIDLALSAPLT